VLVGVRGVECVEQSVAVPEDIVVLVGVDDVLLLFLRRLLHHIPLVEIDQPRSLTLRVAVLTLLVHLAVLRFEQRVAFEAFPCRDVSIRYGRCCFWRAQ
jgi:hypothetical protein